MSSHSTSVASRFESLLPETCLKHRSLKFRWLRDVATKGPGPIRKIYFCLQGAVSFRIEGQDVALVNQDLLLIPKNEWFDYRNDQAETARLLLIHIPSFEIEAEEFAE